MRSGKWFGSRGLTSAEEATRFLQNYYSPALDASPATLATFTLPGAKTFTSRDIEALSKHAIDCASKHLNVYFHIHLHSLAEGFHRAHRGSAGTVAAAIGLFADIDAEGPGRHKPDECLCPTVEDALFVVQEFNQTCSPLRTAFTITSGHGCYPAILFREPLLVVAPESLVWLEQLNRRFHAALHLIAAKHGWTGAVEYCDLAKVLRLPGTVNWKDPMDPKSVALVEADAARFDPVEIDELLPDPKDTAHATRSAIYGGNVNIVVRPSVQVSRLSRVLCELDPHFADTWNHRRSDLHDQSCSGYDLSLANITVGLGLTDQQITDLLVLHRQQFPRRKKARRGIGYLNYLAKCINLARVGRTSSEGAEAEWDRFDAALRAATTAPSDALARKSTTGR